MREGGELREGDRGSFKRAAHERQELGSAARSILPATTRSLLGARLGHLRCLESRFFLTQCWQNTWQHLVMSVSLGLSWHTAHFTMFL